MIIANMEWHQDNIGLILKILPPGVSDHAMIYLTGDIEVYVRRSHFKFINVITRMDGYGSVVDNSLGQSMEGRPVARFWHKLRRL